MHTIVVTHPILKAGLTDLYDAGYEVQMPEDESRGGDSGEDALIAAAGEADALITTAKDPVTGRVMDACPRLRIVAQYGVGYDNVDVEAAQARGLPVTHTPGVLTDATADFTMALLLAAARRVVEADRFVRERRGEPWGATLLLGTDLKGKALGIIGLGRIGQAVARRALGFGMDILYYSRRRANPTVERQTTARHVGLNELLRTSDVVSLHCPLNAGSAHLIDAAALRAMKPTALLINTARGRVVDETALVEALRKGEIAGAGLDVFEAEPDVHADLLENERLENGRVVLAPHLASATVETRTAMGRMCAEAVTAALEGAEKIPYRVA